MRRRLLRAEWIKTGTGLGFATVTEDFGGFGDFELLGG